MPDRQQTPDKRTATARCAHCDWSAQHADTNVLALARFLRARLVEHVQAAHPGVDIRVLHVIDDDEKDAD